VRELTVAARSTLTEHTTAISIVANAIERPDHHRLRRRSDGPWSAALSPVRRPSRRGGPRLINAGIQSGDRVAGMKSRPATSGRLADFALFSIARSVGADLRTSALSRSSGSGRP